MSNKMILKFPSKSKNEALARNVVAFFMMELNPTLSEINEVKTAVSEAVTNAIVHGYPNIEGEVTLICEICGESVHILIEDNGVGMENLTECLEPFYSTKSSDERSGMGFTVMKSFMDEVTVNSKFNEGTTVKMVKKITKTPNV